LDLFEEALLRDLPSLMVFDGCFSVILVWVMAFFNCWHFFEWALLTDLALLSLMVLDGLNSLATLALALAFVSLLLD
jgi:hypothetical protein